MDGKAPNLYFYNDRWIHAERGSVARDQFCRGEFSECARFQVAAKLGGTAVPKDLFPNDHGRSSRLLEASQ